MHRISFAPELSATLSRVSCWTISLLGLLHDLKYAPSFLFGDGTRFRDSDEVAHAAFVLLVVDFEPRPLLHSLAIETVGLRRAHLDDDRLVHLVRDHGAQADLALPAGGRRGLDGFLIGRHQDGSSVFALRARFGLGTSITGASGSNPSSTAFAGCASPPGCASASSRGGEVTIPSSRSLSTVMIR